ncbi:protein of unknown function [Candidatus Hydrogenisulfobacillus filiaventi]|uniref:DUF927 domain-containing protein n=1 Tax=Candidatus Hydrogenisulfobacillus filiaventi TaxID=2707344 RepID=A0A6F8ZJD8_9FIRM|nr:protein of unknown function [Candidatus Hydrogenisulfobacillus filiaventi]
MAEDKDPHRPDETQTSADQDAGKRARSTGSRKARASANAASRVRTRLASPIRSLLPRHRERGGWTAASWSRRRLSANPHVHAGGADAGPEFGPGGMWRCGADGGSDLPSWLRHLRRTDPRPWMRSMAKQWWREHVERMRRRRRAYLVKAQARQWLRQWQSGQRILRDRDLQEAARWEREVARLDGTLAQSIHAAIIDRLRGIGVPKQEAERRLRRVSLQVVRPSKTDIAGSTTDGSAGGDRSGRDEALRVGSLGEVWGSLGLPDRLRTLRVPDGVLFDPDTKLPLVIRSREAEAEEDDGSPAEPDPRPAGLRPYCVAAILVDAQTRERRREIWHLTEGGQWESFSAAVSETEDSRLILRLADRGLPIDHTIKGDAMAYITAWANSGLPVMQTTPVAGQHTADGLDRWEENGADAPRIWVHPGGVWGVKTPEARAAGLPDPAEAVDLRFDNPKAPEIVRRIRPLPGGTEAEAARVLTPLSRAASPPVAWTLLGWFAAALLAPLIRAAGWGEFPFLNVYGPAGTGKSTLIQRLALAFAATDDLGSARRPPFSLVSELSATNSLPVVLDEYRTQDIRQEHLQQLHHYLRMAYRGARETRGQANQTTRDYHLTAPVVLVGESAVEDWALMERSVPVWVGREEIAGHPGAADALRDLRDLGDDALRRVAGWLWARAAETPMTWVREALEAADGSLEDEAAQKAGGLSERPRHNIAIVRAGLYWLGEWIPDLGRELERLDQAMHVLQTVFLRAMDAQQEVRQEEGPVAAMVRLLERQAALPEDRREVMLQPARKAPELLVVHQAQLLAAMARQAAMIGEAWLGRSAFLRLLRSDPELVADVSKAEWVHNGTRKCVVLRIETMLRRFDVPKETWIRPSPAADPATPPAE